MSEPVPRTRGPATSVEPDAIGAPPVPPDDAGIVARISAAVHEPFVEAWRRYEEEAWLPVRRALEAATVAHRRVLAATPDDAPVSVAEVARDVIEPLRAALAGSGSAAALEEELARAAERAKESLAGLPAFLDAPVSRSSAVLLAGAGPVRAVKRAGARVLGPLVWRGRVRRVPVASLARQHLDQVVLRAQASAFRASQRDRAVWLGRFERAWAAWAAAALEPLDGAGEESPGPPAPAPGAHHAAAIALQAELEALADDTTSATGRARGTDFGAPTEFLAASVAVAGTFAADPPSSRPGPGRLTGLARRWDAWAKGAAARLELYGGLVSMRRGIDRILRAMREDWSRTVRAVDSVLEEVSDELSRNRERVKALPPEEEGPSRRLEAERARTDAALARIQSGLPDVDALSDELTSAVEEAINGLDLVREEMPGTLALHDLPDPGDAPRRPPPGGRRVRLRETFLHAFDTLRRERMRAAPSAIREAMRRVHSEVDELREVCGYGYEAAVAEMNDDRAPGSAPPAALAANALARAGNKAAAARDRLREALAAAEDRVAREVGAGSRQLIEHATAARVAAGYLEARTHLTAGLARLWKRWSGRLKRGGARVAAALVRVAGLVRRMVARLGLGPADEVAAELHEHSLAYAQEYPRTLPVVYRRLFSLDPLTDARMLAGREDALEEVWAAWSRRDPGDARGIVVVASPGVGLTSFLNIVADRLSREAPKGVRRTFAKRVREEAHLAASLSEWLDLPETRDLEALADLALEAPRGTLPGFVILEATEHLHIRAPGGAKLFERLLTFMSRTESRVFWVTAITSSAWQLVAKRAPAFVHDVERVVLDELSPDELRRAIMARHRLSGLPLLFAEPRDGRAALRRRTRRLRGTDKQTNPVEADYFQQLHRASQGSIRVALLHWMRSADFATTAGSLLVQPLEPLHSGIGDLERTQNFALKAILDHGTLTVNEYRDVARIPRGEAVHILRSLEEHRLIEAVGAAGEEGRADGAGGPGRGDGPRYRIRPLMTGAVAAHLRSGNILH